MTRMIGGARVPIGGNLVYNGNFEYVPVSNTPSSAASVWLDGSSGGSATNSAYGWGLVGRTGSPTAQFDNTQSHSGKASLKLSTLAAGQYMEACPGKSGATTSPWLCLAKPTTSYTLTFWMKTNLTSGTSADGAYVAIIERFTNGTFSRVTATSTKLLTTTGWTQYSAIFTTLSSTGFIAIDPVLKGSTGAATLIMDAWFDDIFLQTTAAPTTVRPAAGIRTHALNRTAV